MLEGAREIKIHGQWISVAAEVTDLPMLSAHADANELMRWLSGFQRPPRRVFIVHGEAQASEALRSRIDHELRSEEHTSELQSLMRISYAVFCLKKKKEKRTLHCNEHAR